MLIRCKTHNVPTTSRCKICNAPICTYCINEQKSPNICISCERRAQRSNSQRQVTVTRTAKSYSNSNIFSKKMTIGIMVVLAVIILIVIIVFGSNYIRTREANSKLQSISGLLKQNDTPKYESRYLVQMLNIYYNAHKKYPIDIDVFSPQFITATRLEILKERYVYKLDKDKGFMILPRDPTKVDFGKPYLTPKDTY